MPHIPIDPTFRINVKFHQNVCDFIENCSNKFYINGEVFFQPAPHLYKKTDEPNVYDVYVNNQAFDKIQTLQSIPRVGNMVYAWNKKEDVEYGRLVDISVGGVKIKLANTSNIFKKFKYWSNTNPNENDSHRPTE